ncbi:LamG domain-containing protein [Armatimonas rosea]|uniref:LamG-like jellyroll fold domain-containing protein n=1 Tax=Armatimonas rosea TaxID=685828 RepID=A0A7W9SWI5_ARMRO|nr:LamG domain-containing protein [Armatimonas rosea]MBB6053278.1 hypothetical protein [Armatimonas rosea]
MMRIPDILGPINTLVPLNRSHWLNEKRLAWWLSLPSQSGGREFRDLCGLNNATLTNMGNTSNGWRFDTPRPGALGPAILCDGSAGYLSVGSPAALKLQPPFTIAAWIRTPHSADYNCAIANTTAFNNNATSYSIVVQANGSVYADRGSSGPVSSAAGVIPANTWCRVAVVYDTSATTIYVNGQQVATGAAAPTLSYSGSLQLGAYVAGGGRFNGLIDDLSVLGRAFSARDMAEEYWLSLTGYFGVLNRFGLPLNSTSSWFPWYRRGDLLLKGL